MKELATAFVEKLGSISIFFGIVSALGHTLFYVLKGNPRGVQLPHLLAKVCAGAVVPAAFGLIVVGFYLDLVDKVTNLELYLCVSGIALLYISVQALFPKPPE